MIQPFSACHLNYAQVDFQNAFDISYSELCRKITESTHNSTQEQCFFLYEIKTPDAHLTGIVGCLDSSTPTMNKLLPHEKVNNQRYQRYALQLEEYGDSICPIVLTVEGNLVFDDLLNDNRLRDINLFRIESNSEVHSLYQIKNTMLSYEIRKQLNEFDSFLIADGHHRFSALNSLKSKCSNNPFPVLVMVVSSSDIRLQNFNRLLTFDDQRMLDQFFTAIEDNFQKYDCERSEENFGLRVTVQDNTYHFKPETGVVSTHRKMDRLFDMHSCEKKITLASGEKISDANLFQMLIELPVLSFQDVKNEASKGRLLPINTTCFYPKPIPGLIAVRKQNFGSADIEARDSDTMLDYKEEPILV